MKKLIMVLSLISAVTLFAAAQKLDASKVPAAVKTSFAKQYPGITAMWEKENGLFEASFKQNGASISVMYTANGMMTEIETDIKVAELPVAVLAYVKEHYKGKMIKEGAKITKADGTVNYEAEIDGKDVIFDMNGKFLKEMKE